MLETLLEDSEELAVAEAERDAPIHVEVPDFVHVRHLDDQIVQGRPRQQGQPLVVHSLQVEQVLHDTLDLWVVEPRHLRDLGQQDDDHLDDLLVQTRLFPNHEVDDEILDAQLLCSGYLGPVLCEELLEGRCGDELHELRSRLLKVQLECAKVRHILSEIFQLLVGPLSLIV